MTPPTPFEQARDELFQQIMRCEVIGASPDHQGEWFNETVAYFAERYPELKPADVSDLRKLGERFVQPPKATIIVDDAPAAVSDVPSPEAEAIDALVGDEVGSDIEQSSETADVEEAEPVPV